LVAVLEKRKKKRRRKMAFATVTATWCMLAAAVGTTTTTWNSGILLASAQDIEQLADSPAIIEQAEAPTGPEGPETEVPSDILEQLEQDAAGVEELLANFGTNVPTSWQNFIDTSDCPTPFSGGYWRHAYIAPAQWKGAKWKFSAYACEWKKWSNTTKLVEVPNKIKEKKFSSVPNSFGIATEYFLNEDAIAGCRGKTWKYSAPVFKSGHLQAPDWKPIKCIVRFGEVNTLGSASWIRFETPWATWFNEFIATNAPFLAPALRAPDVQTAIATAQEENIEFEGASDRESEQVGVSFGPDGAELSAPEREAEGVLPQSREGGGPGFGAQPTPLPTQVIPTDPAVAPQLTGPAPGANPALTPLELLQQTLATPGVIPSKALPKVSAKATPKGLSVGVPLNPVQAGKQALHNYGAMNAALGDSMSTAYNTAENLAQQGAKAAVEAAKTAADVAKEVQAKVASSEQFQKVSSEIRKRINASPTAQKAFGQYQAMKESPAFQKAASLVTEAAQKSAQSSQP